MTIATRDQLINALGNNCSRFVIDKASIANAAAGQFFSLWRATGVPSQASIPAAAAIPTHTTTGALSFAQQTSPSTSYLAYISAKMANVQSLEIHDRVAHMGGLSGTVTTAQTVGIDLSSSGLNLAAERRGDANYSDIEWYIEVYTDMGATGVNATAAVTYDDGSTGNLAAVALGATPRAGRMYQLLPAVAGRWIRGVTSITLSATTGTAGSFGVTATRPRSEVDVDSANKGKPYDWASLGLPEIPNNACLFFVVPCVTTSTGTVRAKGKIAHG
jgi:hypothetical protein